MYSLLNSLFAGKRTSEDVAGAQAQAWRDNAPHETAFARVAMRFGAI